MIETVTGLPDVTLGAEAGESPLDAQRGEDGVTLRNLVVESDQGATIAATHGDAVVLVEGCTFRPGPGQQGDASGLSIETPGEVTVRSSAFLDSGEGSTQGGGLRVEDAERVLIEDSRFEGNQGGTGGGLALFDLARDFTVELVRSSFVGNEASSGGAIWLYVTDGEGVVRLEDVDAEDNTASFGATYELAAREGGEMAISGGSVTGSRSPDGLEFGTAIVLTYDAHLVVEDLEASDNDVGLIHGCEDMAGTVSFEYLDGDCL
ncbi:MAG TPA: hypothetical protein QGF58_20180 [Myxococcota bacterium]|nr:hypothetical protein [Myxococcota bacterium]